MTKHTKLLKVDLFLTIVFLLLILIVNVTQGESLVGDSPYATTHIKWPTNEWIKSWNGKPYRASAFLWKTFGDDLDGIGRFLDDPRDSIFELHLINEVCQFWGRCGSYEFLSGISMQSYSKGLKAKDPILMGKLRNYFQRISKYILPRLDLNDRCYISPGLESNISDPVAAKNLLSVTRDYFGSRCRIVWNPKGLNNLRKVEGMDVLEVHGDKAKLTPPCIANLDGNDMYEVNVPLYINRFKTCDATFLWTQRFNLISHGPFVDPRKRTGFPSTVDFAFVRKYTGKEVIPPVIPVWGPEDEKSLKGCQAVFKKSDGNGGFLWKPQSDTQPGAVVLFPSRYRVPFSRVKLVNKGLEIEQMRYSGVGNPDSGGNRQHWRGSTPGNKLPYNLVVKTSERACWVLRDPHERFD